MRRMSENNEPRRVGNTNEQDLLASHLLRVPFPEQVPFLRLLLDSELAFVTQIMDAYKRKYPSLHMTHWSMN